MQRRLPSLKITRPHIYKRWNGHKFWREKSQETSHTWGLGGSQNRQKCKKSLKEILWTVEISQWSPFSATTNTFRSELRRHNSWAEKRLIRTGNNISLGSINIFIFLFLTSTLLVTNTKVIMTTTTTTFIIMINMINRLDCWQLMENRRSIQVCFEVSRLQEGRLGNYFDYYADGDESDDNYD